MSLQARRLGSAARDVHACHRPNTKFRLSFGCPERETGERREVCRRFAELGLTSLGGVSWWPSLVSRICGVRSWDMLCCVCAVLCIRVRDEKHKLTILVWYTRCSGSAIRAITSVSVLEVQTRPGFSSESEVSPAHSEANAASAALYQPHVRRSPESMFTDRQSSRFGPVRWHGVRLGKSETRDASARQELRSCGGTTRICGEYYPK